MDEFQDATLRRKRQHSEGQSPWQQNPYDDQQPGPSNADELDTLTESFKRISTDDELLDEGAGASQVLPDDNEGSLVSPIRVGVGTSEEQFEVPVSPAKIRALTPEEKSGAKFKIPVSPVTLHISPPAPGSNSTQRQLSFDVAGNLITHVAAINTAGLSSNAITGPSLVYAQLATLQEEVVPPQEVMLPQEEGMTPQEEVTMTPQEASVCERPCFCVICEMFVEDSHKNECKLFRVSHTDIDAPRCFAECEKCKGTFFQLSDGRPKDHLCVVPLEIEVVYDINFFYCLVCELRLASSAKFKTHSDTHNKKTYTMETIRGIKTLLPRGTDNEVDLKFCCDYCQVFNFKNRRPLKCAQRHLHPAN